MNTLTIRLIPHGSAEYEETVALRGDILHYPLGIIPTAEQFGAEWHDYHIACYRDDLLVGCLILTPLPNGELKMRQVAVAEELQGQGIGRAMVLFSERFAREHGFTEITMHARETAVPFYENLGYDRIGEEFEEVTIRHWKMRKVLQG
jgi:ribosomal protein S18 acetylase RimI-like enzyme